MPSLNSKYNDNSMFDKIMIKLMIIACSISNSFKLIMVYSKFEQIMSNTVTDALEPSHVYINRRHTANFQIKNL